MEAGKETCIGFDVGKAAHRACAVSCKTGEILFNGAIENREGPIDEVLGLAGRGALVVVDQKRSIGALVLERPRAAGMDVAYLPGLSMKRARDMLPGVAKTDEIDAEVIARTAIGMPWTLRPSSRRRRRKRGDQAALLPRKVPDEVLDKLEEQAALRLAGNRSCLRGGSRPGAGVRA
ncbi:MAG: transposase [Eggerthella lenta]